MQNAAIRRFLETPLPWPPELEAGVRYERLQDDHDGTGRGMLSVSFTPDGDAWVWTDSHQGVPLRFRAPLGGSRSPRVNNALRLLALAMKLDEEQFPDQ